MKIAFIPLLFMILLVLLYILTLVISSTQITETKTGFTISFDTTKYPERGSIGKFLFLILFLALPSRRVFSTIFDRPKLRLKQLLLMISWGLVFVSFSWNIGQIFFPAHVEIEIFEIVKMYERGNIIGNLITIVSFGILTPIIEELIFRDILPFNEKYKTWSLILSTIVFAAIHGTLILILFTLMLGFFLGWMMIQGYSIHFAILIHGIVNLSTRYIGDLFINTLNILPIVQWAISIILLGSLIWLTKKIIKRNESTIAI
jgi:membrane protease YdiL (CAAX protease family)